MLQVKAFCKIISRLQVIKLFANVSAFSCPVVSHVFLELIPMKSLILFPLIIGKWECLTSFQFLKNYLKCEIVCFSDFIFVCLKYLCQLRGI